MPKHFFFYGTLQSEHLSGAARQIFPKLKRVDEGFVKGRLFAIIAPYLTYPALVLGAGSKDNVHGICYEMRPNFTGADLGLLDAYEEYFSDKLTSSEYLRQELPITLKSGAWLGAWVYGYNFPVPETAPPIPSGDFRDYARHYRQYGK